MPAERLGTRAGTLDYDFRARVCSDPDVSLTRTSGMTSARDMASERLSTVIRMTAQDGRRAIELLRQDDTGKRVRQRHRTERNLQPGRVAHRLAEPVRSADDDTNALGATVAC